MPRSPLHSEDEVATASAEFLKEHLRWEFEVVFEHREYSSNEEMARDLNFAGASSVSKWRTGAEVLSMPCAKKLDDMGHAPTIGGSFVALRNAYRRASRRKEDERSRKPIQYDVFLASPMASAQGTAEYRKEREAAQDVKAVLENRCEFTVYYAGDLLESDEQFDTPEIAAEVNFAALERTKFFVLLSQTLLNRPSSVHVEAGYALARDIPSLYIVPDHRSLPFVLQNLGEERSGVLPPVSIQYLSTTAEATSLLRLHGLEIFERLENLRRAARKRRKRV